MKLLNSSSRPPSYGNSTTVTAYSVVYEVQFNKLGDPEHLRLIPRTSTFSLISPGLNTLHLFFNLLLFSSQILQSSYLQDLQLRRRLHAFINVLAFLLQIPDINVLLFQGSFRCLHAHFILLISSCVSGRHATLTCTPNSFSDVGGHLDRS